MKRSPAGSLADVVNRHDVRVIEGGGGARLAQESIDGVRLLAVGVPHHLDRDHAVQPGIERAVHLTHPTAADLRVNAIRSDGFQTPRHAANYIREAL